MHRYDIPTPALLVDINKLRANIDQMAERARAAGVALRPHIKTHKTPAIAHMQIAAGAVGITCAKLGEAEVMAAAGIRDILVAYPIVGNDKIERLLNLARLVTLATTVDTLEAAATLSRAAIARGQRIDVLVEIDSGYGRCGVAPGQPTLDLVQAVSRLPGLRFRGLMVMAGHIYKEHDRERQRAVAQAEANLGVEHARLLRERGIEVAVISVGSTPAARFLTEVKGMTEARPGTYVFNDIINADLGVCTRDQIALTVLTTVVSVPSPDRFIVDAGSKTLTDSKSSRIPGRGPIVGMDGVSVTWLCEEHGIVNLPPGVSPPPLGAKLEVLPNYVSDVVNLADRLWVVDDEEVLGTWAVQARGKNT